MDANFEEVQTQVSIDLHPSKLRCVVDSVTEQLDSLLLTFQEELCGVVLAYRDEQIQTKSPLVHSFFPYFHIDAVATLQILRLQPGQHLCAIPTLDALFSVPRRAVCAQGVTKIQIDAICFTSHRCVLACFVFHVDQAHKEDRATHVTSLARRLLTGVMLVTPSLDRPSQENEDASAYSFPLDVSIRMLHSRAALFARAANAFQFQVS
jgi:hypothetical protein